VTICADNLFVLTGGPGSGKSTLTEALAEAGFARSVEAGRGVIKDQVAIGGDALPWRHPALFAELMLCWEMRSYQMAAGDNGPMFFDRGIPDVVGYLRLAGLKVPKHVERAAGIFRYYRRVFIAPPWERIFRQDGERKQSFAEAERTFAMMAATYRSYGYELIELPLGTVGERRSFVIDKLGLTAPGGHRP
jgi:predicted ATPase